MIKELTPEQIEQIAIYRDKHLDMFFKNTDRIPVDKFTEFINWVYDLSNLKKPEKVHIVDSPKAAQDLANKLCKTTDKHYPVSSYVNIKDLSWLAFYKYFQDVCNIELDEKFNKYYELTKLNVYGTIQFDLACIAIQLPIEINRKVDKLHCEDGPAIKFEDGYCQYYWEGVNVPEKLIMDPDNITSEDILSQDNAEIRRAFREKLGGVAYYTAISGDGALTIIDEDTDNQGFPMKLYETTINDSIINKKVQFIEVTCPSTNRVYNIYPPNQNSTNVWDAKASTFSNEKGKYRHGDVMLKEVGNDFDKPIMET